MNGESFLDLLSQRRSVRAFSAQPVPRAVLERLMQAAVTAPSPTNRQPWRFAVVTKASLRQRITEAVRLRAEEMKAIIRQGHHAEDFGQYGDFFHEPLSTAAAIIVPQYRVYPDLIANLVASGGGDPTKFHTAAWSSRSRTSRGTGVAVKARTLRRMEKKSSMASPFIRA